MRRSVNPDEGERSTGEPNAGDLHVRFGGRGVRNQSDFPTPITNSTSPWTPGKDVMDTPKTREV